MILYKEKARYTDEARKQRTKGVVTLAVVIRADGAVTDIMVVKGLPNGLDDEAIAAAKKVRFQPATQSGRPVSVKGSLEFTFSPW